MSANDTTVRRPFRECTEVSQLCPVDMTVLAYYPNFGANIFFAVAFGLVVLASATIGTWKRTWTFMLFVTGGSILETVGYAGRVLLHENPWNSSAFQIQICTIILGPTFICAGIYLTLKHVSANLHPALSRVRPRLYPLIFLPADLTCLIVQAIGGGLAAAAGQTNKKLLDGGNQAIIAGIVLQVVVLMLFGATGADYWIRVRRWARAGDHAAGDMALYRAKRFRSFVYAVAAAYACVMIRCVYRVAEMAGGWGNHIMQDEVSFMVLDSSLVLVCVTLLTVFHPGIYFPAMSATRKARTGEKSGSTTTTTTTTTSTPENVKAESGHQSV
ncbi:Sphingoid long-chain base transporter RSB1 [Colletotrichum tanaceti]|uniref:Sphingoid long-chain base transporter RSB1 n=1 Tax=Colletotrichum tanaceti TaxID=1306861 RepID=A0A4U6XUD5_9PEZI|nr:Sphingoid long-chain base transporter RSB1 [Colletotrichum tanaceti]TKW59584.1 Sphingoid long-chain base transporter RSB1 [Colletotrichum tanaceti]